MSYTHLTINERAKIELLPEEGFSIRAIAHKLKCHNSLSRLFQKKPIFLAGSFTPTFTNHSQ